MVLSCENYISSVSGSKGNFIIKYLRFPFSMSWFFSKKLPVISWWKSSNMAIPFFRDLPSRCSFEIAIFDWFYVVNVDKFIIFFSNIFVIISVVSVIDFVIGLVLFSYFDLWRSVSVFINFPWHMDFSKMILILL